MEDIQEMLASNADADARKPGANLMLCNLNSGLAFAQIPIRIMSLCGTRTQQE